MKTKQRNASITTFEQLIEANTGMPASDFLNPKPDPYIKDLSLAVAFTKEKIAQGMPVSIIGDYDCDGDMGTGILEMTIEEYSGKKPYVRIPKRRAEGYGLNASIIDEIDEGLVITVDNGISAVDAVKKAKEKGLDVIILDHHEKREDGIIPPADVVVDPSAIPGSEFTHYCGAALAYRFAKELIPNSKKLDHMLVMASIATVADVMELHGDNRLIVQQGLKLINKRKVMQGLNILLNELNLNYIDEDTYGFGIGPVCNASGRLYDDGPMDVVELFTADCDVFDDEETERLTELAKLLIKRNEKRREVVKASMILTNNIIKEENLENDAVMVVYHPDFDEGIIGIIAGQLAEDYRRPAIAFTNSKTDGVLKGSGRNYGDVNLKAMLDYATELFVGYGGHKGAAGMSIKAENVEALKKKATQYLKETGFSYEDDLDVTYYDLEISETKVPETIQLMKKYAPFGQGNARPVFKINNYSLSPKGRDFFKIMGKDKNHIRFFGRYTDAVGFDLVKPYEDAGKPKVMNVVGNLSQNFFNGRFTDQIEILEFEAANKKTQKTENENSVLNELETLLVFS